MPDSVRAVMDHAAVCESRAGLGGYGGVHAAVYRGFRVTGWGVNECQRCGKVVRGWQQALSKHIDSKGCVASAAATQSTAVAAAAAAAAAVAAAASTGHAHSTDLKRGRACVPPCTPDSAGAAVDGTIPRTTSSSARATKRLRCGHGSDNACNDSDSQGRANWRHQISVYGSGGGSSRSSRSTVLRRPRRQAQQAEASRKGVSQGAATCSKAVHGGGAAAVGSCGTANGGDAWAHGYTVTGSGLKVPLAPMPSRCKRARRVRASGGWTSGVCVGSGSGCSGTMGSDSGAMGV